MIGEHAAEAGIDEQRRPLIERQRIGSGCRAKVSGVATWQMSPDGCCRMCCKAVRAGGRWGQHDPTGLPARCARAASPLFLTEPEIRRGIELLHFGNGALLRAMDATLEAAGLGHAHQRALYFIARTPDLTVGDLLAVLGVTEQSLGRVVNDLIARQMIETRAGDRDRRQRLLRLTAAGAALERDLLAAVPRHGDCLFGGGSGGGGRLLGCPGRAVPCRRPQPQAILNPSRFIAFVSCWFFSGVRRARRAGNRRSSSSRIWSAISLRKSETICRNFGLSFGVSSSRYR